LATPNQILAQLTVLFTTINILFRPSEYLQTGETEINSTSEVFTDSNKLDN